MKQNEVLNILKQNLSICMNFFFFFNLKVGRNCTSFHSDFLPFCPKPSILGLPALPWLTRASVYHYAMCFGDGSDSCLDPAHFVQPPSR